MFPSLVSQSLLHSHEVWLVWPPFWINFYLFFLSLSFGCWPEPKYAFSIHPSTPTVTACCYVAVPRAGTSKGMAFLLLTSIILWEAAKIYRLSVLCFCLFIFLFLLNSNKIVWGLLLRPLLNSFTNENWNPKRGSRFPWCQCVHSGLSGALSICTSPCPLEYLSLCPFQMLSI